MTAPTDVIQVEAARARWRADLLAFDAAERRRLAETDGGAIAGAIGAEADAKDAEAAIHRDFAAATEQLSIAKQERDANPQDDLARMRYQQAVDALVTLRSYWRAVGELNGTRRPVMTVNDFPEPTDEDVLVTHGGSN